MRFFRQHRKSSRVFLILALLSLTLQVEMVFACKMLNQSGNAEYCCCPEEAHHSDGYHADNPDTAHNPQPRSCSQPATGASAMPTDLYSTADNGYEPCCELSSRFTVKGGALVDAEPAATEPQAQTYGSSVVPAIADDAQWLASDTIRGPPDTPISTDFPSYNGRDTYLVTQRLRI